MHIRDIIVLTNIITTGLYHLVLSNHCSSFVIWMRILTKKMIWQAHRVLLTCTIFPTLFMWTCITYFFGKMTYRTPLRLLLNPAIRPYSSAHLGSSTSLAGCSFCLLKIRRCWRSSFPSKIPKLSWVMQRKCHLQKFILWFSYFLITISLT